jgi:hypothetical protein
MIQPLPKSILIPGRKMKEKANGALLLIVSMIFNNLRQSFCEFFWNRHTLCRPGPTHIRFMHRKGLEVKEKTNKCYQVYSSEILESVKPQ